MSRWAALLTHAPASSFAASLLFEDLSTHHNLDGDLPPLGQLLSDTSPAVPTSRLPAAVEEGLDLHPPYQKHIWRLASINTVCAWRLPSKTALHQRTFLRLNRSGGKKNQNKKKSEALMPFQRFHICKCRIFRDPVRIYEAKGRASQFFPQTVNCWGS